MSKLISNLHLNCFGSGRNYFQDLKSRSLFTTVMLLLLAAYVPQAIGQLSQSNPDWVTTWSTSPSTLPPTTPTTDSLRDQTIRLITHTSVGGSALRVRLSNAHGDRPLHIGGVSVALQSAAADTVNGSSRAISFSGAKEIIIPRGATVLSDPINFTVPQTANLAVSIYLPRESGFLTAHGLANQISYISKSGNHLSNRTFPVATETQGWPLLTSIDVLPTPNTKVIVTLGDSITDGMGSTASMNQRWPDLFARRLYNDSSAPDYAVANAGISGNRVTTEDLPIFGQNLQARFGRDVLALSNVSHVILMEGINDIGMSAQNEVPVSAGQIIAGYRQIIAKSHARGIKIIGATLLPYEGAAYYTDAGNQTRQAVNEFIRNSGEFDGVIEFDKVVQDPANPNRIRADFTVDNLHPNDIGYAAMAEFIDLDLFR